MAEKISDILAARRRQNTATIDAEAAKAAQWVALTKERDEAMAALLDARGSIERLTAELLGATDARDKAQKDRSLAVATMEKAKADAATWATQLRETQAMLQADHAERMESDARRITAEAAKGAADEMCQAAQMARQEAEQRITMLMAEIKRPLPDKGPMPKPPEYTLEVTSRDGNDRIKQIRLKPVETK